MDFHISASQIIGGLIFGVVGLYLFRWGKRNQNFWHMILGMGLMIYPYFVTNDWLIWIVGFALSGLAWYLRYI
jgi:hypothetical protein